MLVMVTRGIGTTGLPRRNMLLGHLETNVSSVLKKTEFKVEHRSERSRKNIRSSQECIFSLVSSLNRLGTERDHASTKTNQIHEPIPRPVRHPFRTCAVTTGKTCLLMVMNV